MTCVGVMIVSPNRAFRTRLEYQASAALDLPNRLLVKRRCNGRALTQQRSDGENSNSRRFNRPFDVD